MVNNSSAWLDRTFAALSDPTRRAILERLAQGEAPVTELARPFGMSLPAVSKHLKVLEKAKLVRRHVQGRVHRFSASPERLAAASTWMEDYLKFWQQRLDALDAYLATNTAEENDHGPSGKQNQ